jgi:thiosulfate/3-mercaptopyruvate sulfurtransferase
MTDIVAAEWVRDQPDLRIVDVRDAWEYDGLGHLPGAVSVPFDAFRATEHGAESGEGQGMLPAESDWEALLSEAGIAPDDHVLAYDDHHGVFAARFLVTAELFGHDPSKLHLLDGDFSAWQLEREVTSEAPEESPTDYRVDPPAETPLVDIDAVADAVDSDAVLVRL